MDAPRTSSEEPSNINESDITDSTVTDVVINPAKRLGAREREIHARAWGRVAEENLRV